MQGAGITEMKEKEIVFLEEDKGRGGWGKRLTMGMLQCTQLLCSLLAVCTLVTGVLYGRKPGVTAVAGILAAQIALWAFLRTKKRGEVSWKRRGTVFYGKQGVHAGISLTVILIAALAVVMYRPSFFLMRFIRQRDLHR